MLCQLLCAAKQVYMQFRQKCNIHKTPVSLMPAAEAPQSSLRAEQNNRDQQHISLGAGSTAATCSLTAAFLCCHAFLESIGSGRRGSPDYRRTPCNHQLTRARYTSSYDASACLCFWLLRPSAIKLCSTSHQHAMTYCYCCHQKGHFDLD